MISAYEKARRFVYRNARPLDFARWRYHFEGGSREDVLNALAAYQNADGGFGHALEADFWNPDSTPVATWTATNILREVGLTDANHHIIQGILRYLDSGKDFYDGKWYCTVPGNNAHPHAVWWTCRGEMGETDDNPTVSLAGFALRFSERNSSLYEKAAAIAREAVGRFPCQAKADDHTTLCYQDLLIYCESMADFKLFDLDSFREAVNTAVKEQLCREPEKWYTEYVCKPSFFFDITGRVFDIVDPVLCSMEADMIRDQQQADGSWPITWQWWTEYPEYHISANWWRVSFCINNLLYLRFCGKNVYTP